MINVHVCANDRKTGNWNCFVGHNVTCVWIHIPLPATIIASKCGNVFYNTAQNAPLRTVMS